MKIEILGMGCQKCNALEQAAKQAAKELGIDAEFVKVENVKEIMKYGVMTTPALVVDGVVKAVGKALGKEEIKTMLKIS
ncbi:MAG: thioredoxin family protein [Veillonellales bacterium]